MLVYNTILFYFIVDDGPVLATWKFLFVSASVKQHFKEKFNSQLMQTHGTTLFLGAFPKENCSKMEQPPEFVLF